MGAVQSSGPHQIEQESDSPVKNRHHNSDLSLRECCINMNALPFLVMNGENRNMNQYQGKLRGVLLNSTIYDGSVLLQVAVPCQINVELQEQMRVSSLSPIEKKTLLRQHGFLEVRNQIHRNVLVELCYVTAEDTDAVDTALDPFINTRVIVYIRSMKRDGKRIKKCYGDVYLGKGCCYNLAQYMMEKAVVRRK